MKYSYPHIRKTARRLPILCAVYFAAFAFCFFYFFQCDVLAQIQFHLSEGATVFHPLMAASLSTFLFTLLGLFIGRLLHELPLRAMASAWFLPFFLAGALTSWRFPQYGDTESSLEWWVYLICILAYVLWLLFLRLFPDSSKEKQSSSAYVWPNLLLLLLFTLLTLGVSNTNVVVHHTLASARHLQEGRSDLVLHEAQWEKQPSQALSAMTALALSRQGCLGDSLFAYPQPLGLKGLLPVRDDTLLFNNLPLAVGYHLGYQKSDRTEPLFFLHVAGQRPKASAAVRQYMLCAYLLDRNLEVFADSLLANDTISSSLPRHYQEAYVLFQHFHPEFTDSIPDADLYARFSNFLTERAVLEDANREFHVSDAFSATYWNYYYSRAFLNKKKERVR